MMRQQWRQLLLLVAFLLFPLTIYYFSPVFPVVGAAKGVITGSLVVFGTMGVAAMIFGRTYCGWCCPAAGLQEVCFAVNSKPALGGRYDAIKYLLWVPWITAIIVISVRYGGYHKLDFFFGTEHGLSVHDAVGYTIYFAMVAIIVVMGILGGRRAFCHYLCWMAPFMVIGARLRRLIPGVGVRLERRVAECRHCGLCSRHCPMSLNVEKLMQQLRPFHDECVLCGRCADVCPQAAIALAFWTKGKSDDGWRAGADRL
ncbi:MAG TPA: 4Fe-4S dicluster domain-containing protein [Patescibacteria group bacterium]|nr:4Fe-4S dicluster domain-containing protein [Patescibacteria group bacterium]